MKSLNDYLHQAESVRGEEEAGKLRTLFLLFLFLWSILNPSAAWIIITSLVLLLLNLLFIYINRQFKVIFNSYLLLSIEIFLVTFWSFLFSSDAGEASFPIVPLLLYLLYCASLRLKVNLIVMSGIESILFMNLIYLYSLITSSGALSDNILKWPGFGNQVVSTFIIIGFTIAMVSRPRIIRRLVNQQQIYFDMVRNENFPLSDSIDDISDHFSLSSREKEVLSILIQGKTYRMIAGELFISLDTVKSHIKSIYRKCEVNSKAELLGVLQNILSESALVREQDSE